MRVSTQTVPSSGIHDFGSTCDYVSREELGCLASAESVVEEIRVHAECKDLSVEGEWFLAHTLRVTWKAYGELMSMVGMWT